MKIWATALLIPVAVFLQSTLLFQTLPGGVTPDLTLMLTLASGLAWGAAGGSAAGLWGGALVGAARGAMALPMAFLYGLVGWLAGMHGEKTHDRWTYPVVGVTLATLLTALDCQVSGRILGVTPSLNWMIAYIAWAGAGSLLLAFIRK